MMEGCFRFWLFEMGEIGVGILWDMNHSRMIRIVAGIRGSGYNLVGVKSRGLALTFKSPQQG